MVKHFVKFLFVFCTLLILFLSSACTTMIHSKPGTTTTIIMVRHAERTATGNQLTKLGQQNARALVDEIGSMNISAIYSPNLIRNLDTVRPLARHLGINITKVSDDPNEQDIVIDIMNKYAGETVLWVGNTTNLPGIYSSLGGTGEPPVKYGDLYIITVPDEGHSTVVKKRWGKRK